MFSRVLLATVLVPANTPHRYIGGSDEPVRVVSVQPSSKVEQTNL